jgi:hypothetical protein
MRLKQSGSSLVEITVAMALGMLCLGAIMSGVSNLISMSKAAREGSHLAEGVTAMDSYLKTNGASIVVNGTAPGFPNPYQPTAAQLKAGTFLASFISDTTPFGGTLQFTVRRGPRNDLLGLVCDTQTITQSGQPSPQLAAEVVMAANGAGLRTSIAEPGVLNGPGQVGIVSPVNGPSIVCAWAYLPTPV